MSGVDVAGLVLGALGTLQQAIKLAQTLRDMCKAYKTNPYNLETLIQRYKDFREDVKGLQRQFLELSADLHAPNSTVIEGHLERMENLFTESVETLFKTIKRIERQSRIYKILSFLRAISIASECNKLDKNLKDADTMLVGVNNAMITIEESKKNLNATVNESAALQKKTSQYFRHYFGDRAPDRSNSDPRSVVDSWKKSFIVPPNPGDIVLNFNARDSRGHPATPEALVKTYFMQRVPSMPLTIAMAGMSGVGKSCVLRALPHDPEIRKQFQDGIYFLSLGMDSDKDAILKQAIDLVRYTGGNATALAMQRFPKVDDVMKKALQWFQGKTWLLLVDDVCDGNGIGRETLCKLMEVLAACYGSAIVFTTRDVQIALQGANRVWFRPKDPLGQDARRILLNCSNFKEADVTDNQCEEAIQALLRKCDGLPVALAIVGRIVSLQADTLIEEQRSKAWTSALKKFHDSALIQDGGEDYPELSHAFSAHYPKLSHAFSAALRVLDEDNSRRSSFIPDRTYKKMHRVLSVLRQQEWIPLSVLRILWDLETIDQAGEVVRNLAEMHLVVREISRVNDEDVEGIILHDLIHMFALKEAANEINALHNDLLNRISSFYCERTDEDRGCRQWWRFLPNDGYIFGNLSWHLIHAGKCDELLNLLLCPEWIAVQVQVGGYLQLENDFTRLIKHIDENPGVIVGDPDIIKNSMKSLKTIVEAVMLSSAYIFSNPSEIWFQLHGRLSKLAATNTKIERFLAYAESGAEMPWIKPLNDCLAAAGSALKCLITHPAPIRCMDTLPDDDKLVCGCHDGSIVILNTEGGSAVREWPAHEGRVTSVVTAVKGTKVVSCSGNNPMKVWNAATGALTFHPTWVSDPATVLALSPDDRTVLSAGKNNFVTIWDVESCKFQRKRPTPHNGGINALTVTPCGKYVVSGGEDGTVQMWDINSGIATKAAMEGHTDEVLSVAVSNDGKLVVSGSKDGTARIWKIRPLTPESAEGPTLNIGMDVTCVTITKDAQGETFVITGSSDTQVRLWRLAERNPILLRGHSAEINDLTLSSSRARVVSCSNDGFTGKIRAWDIEAAKNVGSSMTGHSLSVKSLAASPDGKHVVSGSGDKTIRIWNIRSGKQVWRTLEGHTNWVSGVAVTADGSRVVSVSYDKTVRIWDLKRGRQIGEPLRGHEGAIRCLALLSKEPTVVTSSDMDNRIWLWDISDERNGCRKLVGHTGSVLSLYVSADSERIISRSDDETIRVWHVENGTCIRTIPNQGCFPLSKKEVMYIANEVDDSGDEGVVGLRCQGTQIVRDQGMNMEYFEQKVEVLATMEADVSSWVTVGNTLCVGTENGQVAFLQVQN